MRISCYFISIFFVFHCFGEDVDKALPLSDTECEASAYIAGTVNAVTGTFSDYEVDMVIPGTNPIVIARSHNSRDYSKGLLSRGWRSSLYSHIYGNRHTEELQNKKTQKFRQLNYIEPSGACICYHGADTDGPNTYTFHQDFQQNRFATNAGRQEISARTNSKNVELRMSSWGSEKVEVVNGKQESRHYFRNPKNKLNHFQLIREILPSGLTTEYGYSPFTYKLAEVTAKGEGGVFGKVSIQQDGNKAMTFLADDGRKVVYRFREMKRQDYDSSYYLSEVVRPDRPLVKYEYERLDKSTFSQVKRKILPENRYQELTYYRHSDLKYKGKDEYKNYLIGDRVKQIIEPVGVDGAPVTTYKFTYNITGKLENKDHYGYTTVVDAYGRKKDYHYDTAQRLTQIITYGSQNQSHVYSTVKVIWNDAVPLKGALLGRVLYDQNANPVCSRFYNYDTHGNIISERFFGNLSGNSKPIQISSTNNLPTNNGADEYTVLYTYMDHAPFLRLEEKDKYQTTRYQYYEENDLLKAKFILDGEKIKKREFYRYDACSTLVEKIEDDGSSLVSNDLSNVSHRFITCIKPKAQAPCKGYPEVIEEKYFNVKTGQEHLLKKLVREFSKEGWLLSEQTFDAEDQFRFMETYEYDSMGNVVKHVDKLGQTTIKEYDANGNVVKEIGPRPGFQKEYTYDFANRLIREDEWCDGTVMTRRFTYDYCGDKTSETDYSGNVTRYTYNEHHQVARIDYPDGSFVEKEYDILGNVTCERNAFGAEIITENTVRGKPFRKRFPDGTFELSVYRDDGLLIKKSERNGSYSIYEYDHQKRPTKVSTYDHSGNFIRATTKTYSAFHITSETDGEGRVIFYEYDAAGRKAKMIQGDTIIQYFYDTLGRVEKEIHSEASVKVFSYDNLGKKIEERIESMQGDVLRKIGYAYDAFGNRSHVFEYNENGMLTTKTVYNSKKQPLLIVDALGNETHIKYDYLYRNTRGETVLSVMTIDPLGRVKQVVHDVRGREAHIIQKNGMGQTIGELIKTYDSVGQLVLEHYVVYEGDTPTRTIDNAYEYDSAGRVIALIEGAKSVEQKTTRYTYNTNGQREKIIKNSGTSIHHKYDGIGRLNEMFSSDLTVDYRYIYDRVDNLIESIDQKNRSTKRSYNARNQILEEVLANGLKVSYLYDGMGRMRKVTLPDASAIEYNYNAADLTEVRRKEWVHRYAAYDLSGRILQAECCGAAGTLTYGWDALKRIKNLHYSADESIAPQGKSRTTSETLCYEQKDFTYDAVGNLIEYQDSQNAHQYAYDDYNQIKSEKGATEHTYRHDSLSNRTEYDQESYAYNALNQREGEKYDASGNLVEYQGRQCTYDALDRLISVVVGHEVYRYEYDCFNRRIVKDGGGKRLDFIYLDKNEIGSVTNGKIQELRVLGKGLGAEIGAAVLMELQGKSYVPVHNYRGDVIHLVDPQTRKVADSYQYTAFGVQEQGGVLSPWRFQSKRVDGETGLINFGRRYYCPDRGAWLTPDPLGFEAGPNLYAYVNANPLTHLDEYGLFTISILLAGAQLHYNLAARAMCPNNGSPYRTYENNRNHGTVFSHDYMYKGNFARKNEKDSFRNPSMWVIPGKETKDRFVTFTNGINTTLEEALSNARHLSKLLGGERVILIYNPTIGALKDLGCCINSNANLASAVVPMLHKTWDSILDHHPNAQIMHYYHSEGGLNTRLAAASYDSEKRQRIHGVGLNPGGYVDRNHMASTINIRSSRDGVSLLGYGLLENLDRLITVKAQPGTELHDHGMQSKTLEEQIKQYGDRFLGS